MHMYSLQGPAYLTVEPDQSIIDLAYLIGLEVHVGPSHDHFHIKPAMKYTNTNTHLASCALPTLGDVRVSVEVFSKILIDIASGMEIKTAFEKQGYTYIDEY